MLKRIDFIPPMAPTLAKSPPAGPDWLHEVKFDGWRVQVHLNDGSYVLYSKNGADYTKRFSQLRSVLDKLPRQSAVLDCELVACDDNGMPCFRTLMELGNKAPALCLVGFDLLHLDGVRLMPIAIEQRKAILTTLVEKIGSPRHLQISDAFDDPIELLDTCHRMGFEGIVSKRRGSAYRSGSTKDWVKVKTAAWRAASRDRFQLLYRKRVA